MPKSNSVELQVTVTFTVSLSSPKQASWVEAETRRAISRALARIIKHDHTVVVESEVL